uniref:SKP1 component POZ domain-containing protein n=1 Tax=Palpitomonas bilix TaxID=652834 RepID=A0A7S3GJJ1_9EUKA|mmetsp:Transcript_6021/g.14631  ORF Transcript_6021/g.14631 Transcript_6021/m.14631 type:complete len:181 (+) Transcript_6021:137-679(+)|eukprot:CAMPEP_0113872834 /NCGR_PEP_ID=MMETSP0780_2-20120614/3435_1 /TAXON_ID=652834 /ORGANISM="Palpitomonas bilix" /LENGTH=180 /DNA_ID=CAMNT_0000858413 /DNA_START=119 /DNA_END=661 /DNA_ORIENTATION=+ /assembly_acc=CAM_ASM_000599
MSITLLSGDKQSVVVSRQTASLSHTIASMIEDFHAEEEVPPLPIDNVTGSVLEKVMNYCGERQNMVREGVEYDDIKKWETEFFKDMAEEELYPIILAANYLDIKPLLEASAGKAAEEISKCGTPAEIRAKYGIDVPTFATFGDGKANTAAEVAAAEERAAVMAKYKWVFDQIDELLKVNE